MIKKKFLVKTNIHKINFSFTKNPVLVGFFEANNLKSQIDLFLINNQIDQNDSLVFELELIHQIKTLFSSTVKDYSLKNPHLDIKNNKLTYYFYSTT